MQNATHLPFTPKSPHPPPLSEFTNSPCRGVLRNAYSLLVASASTQSLLLHLQTNTSLATPVPSSDTSQRCGQPQAARKQRDGSEQRQLQVGALRAVGLGETYHGTKSTFSGKDRRLPLEIYLNTEGAEIRPDTGSSTGQLLVVHNGEALTPLQTPVDSSSSAGSSTVPVPMQVCLPLFLSHIVHRLRCPNDVSFLTGRQHISCERQP